MVSRAVLLVVAACASSLLFATLADAVCELPSNLGKLSVCKGNARDVVIGPSGGPNCNQVVVDQSFTGQKGFGKITIEKGGGLFFPDERISLDAERIEVNGLLQAGTSACPIGTVKPTNVVTMTFTGSRACPKGNCSGNNKGIFVNAGGQLRLFGLKGTIKKEQSWTWLSAPSPVNDSSLEVADDIATGPGAWQDGDWIVVSTTSFNPFETEFVRIQKPGERKVGERVVGSKFTLDQHKLKYAHFGGPDPGVPSKDNRNAGEATNYGVDERAEVGLISRNIKLTAQISGDEPSRHWGGEIKIVKGFAKAEIQGVEIEKFGKDQLGSYPIHIHEIGTFTAGTLLVNANSIHHSYNKCITIHSTENVTITNNVCARIVGHIFYQEVGDEHNTRYQRNLGLGAMSNDFEIYAPTSTNDEKRKKLIKDHFWAGDNLTQDADSRDYNQYDGLRIPNTDQQDNPTHGSCFKPDPAGAPGSKNDPFTSNLVEAQPIKAGQLRCPSDLYYVEPPSGFWLINPGAVLVDNSIGGCQGVGRAYWYVPPAEVLDTQKYPPAKRQELLNLKHKVVGQFKNNRARACYAGLYGETEFGVRSEILNPRAGGVPSGHPIIATFEQFTATRNRKRGVWLRPNWYVLKEGRFATNAENVTLVTAGGLDGVAPGVWSLLQDSVVVGSSANKTDRFGPCPYDNAINTFDDKPPKLGPKSGGKLGCVDQTPIPPDQRFRGGDIFVSGDGYPDLVRFQIGYMIYDGPVRMENNRFVNFKVDIAPRLTSADKTFVAEYSKQVRPLDHDFVYEGDAALGWFQSNQSMYPVNTVGSGFTFTNVDLRHQIYTDVVNRARFNDGDQNTAVIDTDGSLAGFVLIDKDGRRSTKAFPISLNNLPFNAAYNSVDECLSEGGQNKVFEGRPTALMSPGSVGSLELEALFPTTQPGPRHDQILRFSKDSLDFVGTKFQEHADMELHGRDGRGIWEPKVTSGYGYTVKAEVAVDPRGTQAGIPKVITVTPGDVVMPDISSTNPFFARLGICYTSENNSQNNGHPTSPEQFVIERGYRSYGGGGIPTDRDKTLNLYWNKLSERYVNDQSQKEVCFDLNSANNERNLGPGGCPAHGVTSVPSGGCPSPSTQKKDAFGDDACIYPTSKLVKAECLDASQCQNPLTKTGGVPDLGKYFYDAATGMLFFYVAQEFPNAVGPSPLGSCNSDGTGDASCPDIAMGETFYACPPQGCITYKVTLNDATYTPATSTCAVYPKYEQPAPTPQYRLAYKENNAPVVRTPPGGLGGNDNEFPHYTPAVAPKCQ
jgi:hypothetical protein